eukprot:gnl/TRDRNA2_/TRDRNA2_193048_c0_seq1.p1 gnl/TRDRNA2_/TRDRNA2_193048_c0~~gnl/TRDRNA2_/TRDRNA2_193048_c0_seq1.p1  ORF type:complete len:289 (-),score=50.24 gnl/TRDRNA2_/TRDRNA2_193048_c0_seq1:112-978(-)
MRVNVARLLAVLDPESTRTRRMGVAGASPLGSARSSGRSGDRAGPTTMAGAGTGSARSIASTCSAKDSDTEDCTAFDLLHTEKGFMSFESWYKRALASGIGANAPLVPPAHLGALWLQAFCPPNALPEYAFMELLRAFAECTDSEAFDLFDVLDHDFLGMLGFPQVYLAICLVGALGSRQLTKFLYFHSGHLFRILARGSVGVDAERAAWPRVLTFVRLLGAPSHLISRVGSDCGVRVDAELTYDQFMEVMFPIVQQLDRGAPLRESTVIGENAGSSHAVRSKMCVLL